VQLRWKLSLTYLLAVLVVVGAIAITIRATAVDAVDHHMGGLMAEMHRSMMGGEPDVEAAVVAGVERAILIGLGVALLAALMTTFAASAWITRPLGHMAEVAGSIADGDYERRVLYRARDEIGQFSRAFNGMAAKLQTTEQVRRELLVTISHELRTPLSNIEGYMEGMLDGVMPNDPETFQLVRSEAQRLSRLVADIERVSRLEAGAEHIEPRHVPVAAVVGQAAEGMRPSFEEKGLQLEVEADGSARGWLDPDKVVQVLTNLLQNALRYTQSPGVVRVVARQETDSVRFSVEDSGIGIARSDLPHIFERFYRVDRSRSRASGGAGIGLTVAKSLVEQMGGRIWAESEPGHGTTFHFTLPLAETAG
jgi:signal transduction histidine kinase